MVIKFLILISNKNKIISKRLYDQKKYLNENFNLIDD